LIKHHIRREFRIERGDILEITERLKILNHRRWHYLALKVGRSSIEIDTSHLESLRPTRWIDMRK
jgi:bifunctional DNA-binding transcriptional regulator/antitoxin component of YhaV-PrlF toxin-antitoxin module